MSHYDTNFIKARPPIRPILERIAKEYQIPVDIIIGPSKKREIVRIRHLAMYRARVETGRSYPDIGRMFNRDHTSVISACRKMKND